MPRGIRLRGGRRSGPRLTSGFQHLLDVYTVQFRRHIGLDDLPFDSVATGQHSRKGENENVFDGVSYGLISSFVDGLHQGHAILQHLEIVFKGHSFGVIGQHLYGMIDGGRGIFGREFALNLGQLAGNEGWDFVLADHDDVLFLVCCQRDARMSWVGALDSKALDGN
jgi:hypothetical protein